MKKKLSVLLTALIAIVLAFSFTACGEEALKTLQSAGFTAEGLFEDGITLAASKLDETGSDFASAVEKIANKYYDEEKLAVYDISLLKDNVKVQPNGNVKITMPAPFESALGFVTYHISGEKVEELKTAFADGKISFETSGFSYFAVSANVPDSQKITALKLDGANFGINPDQKNVYYIGDEYEPNPEDVLVKGIKAGVETDYLTKGVDYTVDLGGLNLKKEGVYTVTYVYIKDANVKATVVIEVIDPNKITALELDGANFGFNSDGTAEYKIGDEYEPEPENVLVKGVKANGKKDELTKGVDYTVDLGGLNLKTAGTYTITYTLTANKAITAVLVVKVVA